MGNDFFYDYAVIRVVPKVEREEFINTGIILSCEEKEFLDAKIDINEKKLKALDPDFDIETARTHLDAIYAICIGGKESGKIGELSQRQRFHWLTSPKSTIIQISPVHSGYCSDPAETLKHLFKKIIQGS
jgi:hypothetical protein